MSRIWIDVEDLYLYALTERRPTGIQRLAFEIQRALAERPGAGNTVRFIRHDTLRGEFSVVGWQDVSALYAAMTAPNPAAHRGLSLPQQPPRRGALRRTVVAGLNRLPEPVREPLARAVRQQKAALRTQLAVFASLAQFLRMALRPPRNGAQSRLDPAAAQAFAAAVRPGDILLALGSPWSHRDYPAAVRQARDRHGMKFALLVYDLIPIRHPEWFNPELNAIFTACLGGVVPLADRLLAISRSTARDLEWFAAGHGLALSGPVTPIPVGSGFALAPPAADPPGLPPPGSYVLFVSTIEPRKNHLLLFRIWRRLLAEMPPAEVPTLVFAGSTGWLVGDLLQQLRNAHWLGGKVALFDAPSDADLAALYRGCLFTLFPSLYEGWGLPVSESLAFGKPCVVAKTSSLPEAGGDFARYFDPDDLHDAVRVIRAVLEDRDGLATWEARIRRDFHPTPWSASAEAVLQALAAD